MNKVKKADDKELKAFEKWWNRDLRNISSHNKYLAKRAWLAGIKWNSKLK